MMPDESMRVPNADMSGFNPCSCGSKDLSMHYDQEVDRNADKRQSEFHLAPNVVVRVTCNGCGYSRLTWKAEAQKLWNNHPKDK